MKYIDIVSGDIMAKPIDLGLVLEGEDAEEFWEYEKRKPTKKEIEMFKEAREIYKSHPF